MKKHLLLILSLLVTYPIFSMEEQSSAQKISWQQIASLPSDIKNIVLRYYSTTPDSKKLIDPLFEKAIVANQKELIAHKDQINSLAFNSQNNLLACGSNDGSVSLWDMQGQHQNAIYPIIPTSSNPIIPPITQVAFNPTNSNELAIASANRYLHFWNTTTYTFLQRIQLTGAYMTYFPSGAYKNMGNDVFALSKDGQLLASVNLGNLIDISTAAPNNPLSFTRSSGWNAPMDVIAMAFNSTKSLLAISCQDKNIYIVDANQGTLLHTICGKIEKYDYTHYTLCDDRVTSLVFNSQDILFACSAQETLKMYAINKEKATHIYTFKLPYPSSYSHPTAKPRARCLALSPNNEHLAIGYNDGLVTLINIEKMLALKKYLVEHITLDELLALTRLSLDHTSTKDAKRVVSTKDIIHNILKKKPIVQYHGKNIDITHELFNLATCLANQKHVHPDTKHLQNLSLSKEIKTLPIVFGTLFCLSSHALLHKIAQYYQ